MFGDSESEDGLVTGTSLLHPAAMPPSSPPPASQPEQGQPPTASPEEGMVVKVVVEETSEGEEQDNKGKEQDSESEEQDSEEDGGDGFEHEYGYGYYENYLLEEDEGVFMENEEEEEEEEEDEEEFIPLRDRLRMSVLASRMAAAEPPPASGRDAEALAGPSDGSHLLAPGSREPLVAQVPSGQVFDGNRNSPRGAKRLCGCLLAGSPSEPSGQPGSSTASSGSLEDAPAAKKARLGAEGSGAARGDAWQRREQNARAQMPQAQQLGRSQERIAVVIDPVLLQKAGGVHVLRALQAEKYCCVEASQAIPCSISWRRKIQVDAGTEWVEEERVLTVLQLEDFMGMVYNYKQVAQGSAGQLTTLSGYVTYMMEVMPQKIIALAVVGVEEYFRIQSKKKPPQAAASVNQEEEQGSLRNPGITRRDVEEALVDLQVSKQVQIQMFESWEELGEFVTMFTKAVAEAPFRRAKEETDFPFYSGPGCCGGPKVDHVVNGLLQVWKRQLEQIRQVNFAMAEAIAAAFPSPQLLYQAYSRLTSETERENLLVNIPSCSGAGGTFQAVRPYLSRQIYQQTTSYNPSLYLNYNP
ncbi:crossover junction endonuclease EME1-like isoform X1 [Falco peregrinus]|uniref:crossover junction endonuclease EME1-like isoform X1 n=1 Tax=Falco peregrinus TaxID=8954 RepID=UPI00247A7888|nr:crossover junction endonuclease EME1-like isoform X1 [Falco peregrinus]